MFSSQIQSQGGRAFSPQYIQSCGKPWNMPIISLEPMRYEGVYSYSENWRALHTAIQDDMTLIYVSNINQPQAFLVVSLFLGMLMKIYQSCQRHS